MIPAKHHSYYNFLLCVLVGLVLWYIPITNDIPPTAWRVFAVVIPVILSFILRPFPMGMMVITGLLVLVITKTITLKESLMGFADTTVWLVVAAFLLAGTMIDTGLGKRIALSLVSKFGRSIKGLAYAICSSEVILGTVMPSNTARGGGIHAPIVNSLSHSLGSFNNKQPEKAGQFLSLVGAHANLIAASMFMTGMAANPLVTRAIKDIYGIDFGWGTWALGAIVPGLISMILLPNLIYILSKPTLTDAHKAQTVAKHQLKEMGPISRNEKIMLAVMILMLVLWSTKFLHGIGTTTVALIAVIILLLASAQSWERIIKNEMAWDTLIWLGGLLTLATLLLDYGFIQWFVDQVQHSVTAYSGLSVIIILGIIYFYSMYAFSMLTAHIAAMAAPFLLVCSTASEHTYIAAAVFAYFSCLCGCTTNYSSGPIIIYFGLGYVKAPSWFSIGFIISIFHITIWLCTGLLWWKILGWW